MSDKTIAAMTLALEALENVDGLIIALLGSLLGSPESDAPGAKVQTAIAALREALAQAKQEQEPIAWMVCAVDGKSAYVTDNPNDLQEGQSAYALYPGPFERKPLTDEEIEQIGGAYTAKCWKNDGWSHAFARAIEAAHGITEPSHA